jgi:hypothetical protein
LRLAINPWEIRTGDHSACLRSSAATTIFFR